MELPPLIRINKRNKSKKDEGERNKKRGQAFGLPPFFIYFTLFLTSKIFFKKMLKY